jgi:D-glycero-alpha-D-manno-heptose-7-phosphate kinase
MLIRSKAPLRVSFAGGGTDVSPYPEERGGCVISATINKYAYCTLRPRQDDKIGVTSLDYDTTAEFRKDQEFVFDGKLDLIKAAIGSFKAPTGFDLFIHCDAPPGSGLGASSAIVVAMVGAMKHWLNMPMSEYDIAETAFTIEREKLGIKGGRQDQYAAAFGGFNFIEFAKNRTVVNPLRIKEDIIDELQYRLLMCYTGRTRMSSNIIQEQVKGFVDRNVAVVEALDATKDLAIEMKNALLMGRLDEVGKLMHRGWMEKKKFAGGVSDDHINAIYDAAMSTGALGGKITGAGGGGYMIFLCEFEKRHLVARQLEEAGAVVSSFAFDPRGLRTWIGVEAKER